MGVRILVQVRHAPPTLLLRNLNDSALRVDAASRGVRVRVLGFGFRNPIPYTMFHWQRLQQRGSLTCYL